MKRALTIIALLLLPIMTTACNTMAGAGEDISKGGTKLEKSAEELKNY